MTRQSGKDIWGTLQRYSLQRWPDAAAYKAEFPHDTVSLVGHFSEGTRMSGSLSMPDGHKCPVFDGNLSGGYYTDGIFQCDEPGFASGHWSWWPEASGEGWCTSLAIRAFQDGSQARVDVVFDALCPTGGTLDAITLKTGDGSYSVPASAWVAQWGTAHVDPWSRRYMTLTVPLEIGWTRLITGTFSATTDKGEIIRDYPVYVTNCLPLPSGSVPIDSHVCPGG